MKGIDMTTKRMVLFGVILVAIALAGVAVVKLWARMPTIEENAMGTSSSNFAEDPNKKATEQRNKYWGW